ncbi:hypothetical protein [Bradyrhizobium erythrophlei]|uniref:Uncharacterized protein n=1 Tax=Bradyrhizobium erythrophlei TaxID=1437360 RepID=A0A1M5SHY5_9BRAD|nr:hypothetical protein [Bradyrhizobium erythrophlei]SHH38109.1 hypothetical protein SAMN05443248_4615 [Bradyrhizobium erythrophlei]
MADTANSESLVFSLGDPSVAARCPTTGRLYEVGSGATSHEHQTANFIRERDRAADMPKHETDAEARRRVQRQMEQRGASADEVAVGVANATPMRDCCPQTGREYEDGSGALPKAAQTRRFLSELPPEQQAARKAAFDKLVAVEPAGQA